MAELPPASACSRWRSGRRDEPQRHKGHEGKKRPSGRPGPVNGPDPSNAVIGAAIEVHRTLGPGFLESVYEEAMAIELAERAVSFSRQVPVAVVYKGRPIGRARLDLLVEQSLVVELKAVSELAGIHRAQLISYLKSTGVRLGLLINFNVEVLRDGLRRVIYG